MKRRNLVILLAMAAAGAAGTGFVASGVLAGDPPAPTVATGPGEAEWYRTDADIKVYKTATCGCCTAWVDHLRNSGFSVEAVDMEQQALNDMKQRVGLTRDLASCHTAFIDGYVVEGHVPAGDIRRLVSEGPDVTGVTVPRMPIGSPGMEYGDRRDAYNVLTFDEAGRQERFATHGR